MDPTKLSDAAMSHMIELLKEQRLHRQSQLAHAQEEALRASFKDDVFKALLGTSPLLALDLLQEATPSVGGAGPGGDDYPAPRGSDWVLGGGGPVFGALPRVGRPGDLTNRAPGPLDSVDDRRPLTLGEVWLTSAPSTTSSGGC